MGPIRDNRKQRGPAIRNLPSGKDEADTLLHRIADSVTFKMKLREARLVESYRQREQGTLVSVILPTFNRAGVVKRAIDSVLRQSYRNFELIISDDGSTDGTCDLIRNEYGDIPRLALIRNAHRGASSARNGALQQARGQLMAYLDSDNQWGTHYLMVMANALLDSPGKSCAYCGLRIVNEDRGTQFTKLVDYDRSALVRQNYIDMNIFFHTRDLYQKHGGFDPNLDCLEDWELILRYTQDNSPLVVECCLAEYHISREFNHLSLLCEADSSYRKIRELYRN